jgi:hypothetical protein
MLGADTEKESVGGVTWVPGADGTATIELEVRDWRWLWLRKRRIVLGTYLSA